MLLSLTRGQFPPYKEAMEVDSKISQVICIYVVLQIGLSLSGKNPDASQKSNLASTCATLDLAIAQVGGETLKICFPEEVAKLRKIIADPETLADPSEPPTTNQ